MAVSVHIRSARVVLATGAFAVERGTQWLMELGFDGESRDRSADLRPTLPVVLRW
jgi:hypothetical protein